MTPSRASITVLIGGLILLAIWIGLGSPARRMGTAGPSGPESRPPEREVSSDNQAVDPAEFRAPSNRSAEPSSEGSASTSRATTGAAELVTVHLRVLEDGTEQPIPGARVESFEDSAPGVRETDANGECSFRVPASEDRMQLRIDCEGYFHVRSYWKRSEALEIRLFRSGVLFGRVLDSESGLGVQDVRISIVHGRKCKGCDHGFVVTGPGGAYTLTSVPLRSDSLGLVFEADRYPKQLRSLEIRSDERRVERDFEIERGTEISGTVVDLVTAAPVAGASVAGIPTDSSGAFRGWILPDDDDRSVGIRVEAPGYCRLEADVKRQALGQPLEFQLPRIAVIEGFVRDTEGLPVAGAGVWIQHHRERESQEVSGWGPETTRLARLPENWSLEPEDLSMSAQPTDENGYFRIESAVPWSQLVPLGAEAEGFEFCHHLLERVGAPGEVTRADFVLQREPVETRVTGSVWLNGRQLRACRGRVEWWNASGSGDAEFQDGDFDVAVEPGEHTFRVEIDGLPPSLAGTEFTLRIELGARLERPIELSMPVDSIRGRVTFADGRPAPGVKVSARCPLGEGKADRGQIEVECPTNAEGDYVIDVPDWDRVHRVEAEDHHDVSSVDGIQPGASGVDLVLSVPGRARLRIVEARTRSPVSIYKLRLQWRRAGEEDFRSWMLSSIGADEGGWYEEHLPSGLLDLRAEYYEAGFRPVLLEDVWIPTAGGPPEIEFVFESE